jgi:hypothetical protein
VGSPQVAGVATGYGRRKNEGLTPSCFPQSTETATPFSYHVTYRIVRWVLAVGMLFAALACSGQHSDKSSNSAQAEAVRRTVAASPDALAGGAMPTNAVLHPLPVGGEVQAPVAIERVEPVLPKRLSVTGPLLLEAVIDKQGIVRNVRVLMDGTKPSIGPAYAEALKKWRFRPGTVKGQPVDVTYDMSVIIDVR